MKTYEGFFDDNFEDVLEEQATIKVISIYDDNGNFINEAMRKLYEVKKSLQDQIVRI